MQNKIKKLVKNYIIFFAEIFIRFFMGNKITGIYHFPRDLKKFKDIPLFLGEHIAFAACKQEKTYASRLHVQMHSFILIQEGSKILHTKNGDVKISAGEGLSLKADHYTLSNIIADNAPYQAILLFFDNTALIEFIAKYKNKLK